MHRNALAVLPSPEFASTQRRRHHEESYPCCFDSFSRFCLISSAQDKSKRPSPPEQAQCKFSDGKTITVDYSSPRAKGRKIFGELVPYGQVWRTGANDATTFVTTAAVSADGRDVPAGNYTIFTVPEQNKWTLIVNKKTGEWGIPYKYESEELARFRCRFRRLPAPVENFTIRFDQGGSMPAP